MARARSVVGGWGLAAVVALALGCDSSSPTAPSATHEPAAGGLGPTLLAKSPGPGEVLPIASAPDGSTLKASAPTADSPIGDELVDDSLMPTLTVVNADGTFVGSDFDYRFEVHTRDGGSALVATIGANAALSHAGTVAGGANGRTSYTVPTPARGGSRPPVARTCRAGWEIRPVVGVGALPDPRPRGDRRTDGVESGQRLERIRVASGPPGRERRHDR